MIVEEPRREPCPACNGVNDTANGYYCRPCRAAYGRARRIMGTDVTYVRQSAKNFHRDRKKRCIDHKGGKCERCGWAPKDEFGYAALHLHHPLRDRKWTLGASAMRKWETVVAELDRCEMICANCHIIEHHPDRMKYLSGRPRKPVDERTQYFLDRYSAENPPAAE